jgi:hypothetical protein
LLFGTAGHRVTTAQNDRAPMTTTTTTPTPQPAAPAAPK